MKKSVKCTVLCLLMVCCMVFSLPLTVSAGDFDNALIFDIFISEPPANSHQGYLNLLYYNSSTSEYRVFSYFWTCMSVAGDGDVTYSDDCSVGIDISKSNGSVKLYCYTSIYDFKQMSVGYARIQNGSRSSYYSSSILNDSLDTFVTFYNPSGFILVGYQVFGNGIVINSDFSNSGSNASRPFVVNWGTDALLSSRVTEILAELYILAKNDETIISQLNQLLTHAQTAEELLSSINSISGTISGNVISIKYRVQDIRDLLEEILNSQGESTFEEPSTESISDYNKAEDELVSGADDTSDIEQQIDDFEIDAVSSGKIWSIITEYFMAHPKVMGLVIGVLCLGIIALILNR